MLDVNIFHFTINRQLSPANLKGIQPQLPIPNLLAIDSKPSILQEQLSIKATHPSNQPPIPHLLSQPSGLNVSFRAEDRTKTILMV